VKPGRAWLAGIGLLLLAFGVTYSSPSQDERQQPFGVTAEIGREAASEHHILTIHDVRLAREVELDGWRGTTSGIWLVVDATVEARVERIGLDAELLFGGSRYASSARPGTDTLDGKVGDPGFPETGSMLIELPADAVDRAGSRSTVLRVGPGGDSRLDSLVELRIDLTALDVVERDELEPPKRGTP
jgi:hypothetical protein